MKIRTRSYPYKALILIALFSSVGSFAQVDSSGIYLSASDFKAGKLTYAINCKTEKHKIKLNEFPGKSFITVIHKKKSYKLMKADLFGYRDCDGIVYRIVGNDHDYAIVNPKENILLYVLQTPGSKGTPAQTYYFFSISAEGEVFDLSLFNLKKAVPDNHKFHDLLDAEFGNGGDLARYDSFHKVYKVNRIYQRSLE